eukprot:GHVU01222167.1.p1 GENE.GHVU01222167.1~~GHVU01222167.1.p1  ORF type:complete len:345 (+),score=33.37 GHVU01222167.1:67-1101(+)
MTSVPAPMDIEELRRFILPMPKQQIVDLICSAAAKHVDVSESAQQAVNHSPASKRLMIRNVAFATSNEGFAEFFASFGEAEDVAIVRDKEGRSKGYGFVTYTTVEPVKKILSSDLTLDGRKLAVKLAADSSGDDGQPGSQRETGTALRKKLFVRNLSDDTDSEALKEAFSSFGPLEECVVVRDSEGSSRGYGFVTFESPEAAQKAVQQSQRVINRRVAFVAFAKPSRVVQPSMGGPAAVGLTLRNGGARASGQRDSVQRDQQQQQMMYDPSLMAYGKPPPHAYQDPNMNARAAAGHPMPPYYSQYAATAGMYGPQQIGMHPMPTPGYPDVSQVVGGMGAAQRRY